MGNTPHRGSCVSCAETLGRVRIVRSTIVIVHYIVPEVSLQGAVRYLLPECDKSSDRTEEIARPNGL